MDGAKEIARNSDDNLGNNERHPLSIGMSGDTCSNSINKTTPTRDSYWFAHSGEDESSPANAAKHPGDLKELQLQKEREERIRHFREQQEGERVKRLKELEQSFVLAKKYREQQEEERRRKIEEARIRETERRQQVEERKRQIWEAEQERKEAILRRNMEREARIEARRNAQRNSQCFAFGSSTPRTFDLDLAALGVGRNVGQGSVLMSSVSGRKSEERDLGPPRSTSACSLDRKCGEDYMSRSMVSLSSAFRGRRRTDITPTPTRDRSVTPHTTPRGNHSMRAVSMTRLDQLAQPRRTYLSPAKGYGTTTITANINGGPLAVSPSMSKSMCNLANPTVRKYPPPSPSRNASGNLSRSMLHLADGNTQKDSRRFTPSPTLPPKPTMRSAKSMVHLAPVPRLTRAARLRAVAGACAKSAWNLSKPEESPTAGRFISPGKDSSRSPSRPQSSMSGTSEISAASSSISAVNMRHRPAPRKPRPYSIAGCAVETAPANPPASTKEPERQPRVSERNVSAPKPTRAKSAGREKDNNKLTTVNKKPVPPPKSSEVLARAKTHNVATKDNLRKVPKANVAKSIELAVEKEKNIEPPSKVIEPAINQDTKLQEDSKTQLPDSRNNILENNKTISSPCDSDLPPTNSETLNSEVSLEIKMNINSKSLDSPSSVSVSKDEISDKSSDIPVGNVNIPSVKISILNNSNQVKDIGVNAEKRDNEQDMVVSQSEVLDAESSGKEFTPSKPKITSEEEAKAALAEKRRLAREQAEREAELERQRQEENQRREEEQRRLEELEQQRMEAEQIRLAELHRQLEEEKLRKAIEEQEQKEKEEKERKEEEYRQRAEREEQERKAREEAEKQRIELEERLRKEEEERAERKRRVEQIMARTRKSSQVVNNTQDIRQNGAKNTTEQENNRPATDNGENLLVSPMTDGIVKTPVEQSAIVNSATESNFTNLESGLPPNDVTSQRGPLPDLLNSEIFTNSTYMENGHYEANGDHSFIKNNVSNSFTLSSHNTMGANVVTSPTQTNGYSSHEEMSCTTSPEDASDSAVLINIAGNEQLSGKSPSESADFSKLVDFGETTSTTIFNNENYLINVDNINSNIVNSGNPFVGFEDSRQKKQETPIADLLS